MSELYFQLIYVRPHSAPSCYQTGYMAGGKLHFVESKACPNGPPKGGVWFPVSVTVHGQTAKIYHSGVRVATITSHFALRSREGVFSFHGYQNVILFRKFQIAPQISVSKRCKQVKPNLLKDLMLLPPLPLFPQNHHIVKRFNEITPFPIPLTRQ